MRTPRSKDRAKIGVSRKNAFFLRPRKKRARCERVGLNPQILENFYVLRGLGGRRAGAGTGQDLGGLRCLLSKTQGTKGQKFKFWGRILPGLHVGPCHQGLARQVLLLAKSFKWVADPGSCETRTFFHERKQSIS